MTARTVFRGWLLACACMTASAQTCTTQARMEPATRQAIADAALTLGNAVKSGDANAVKAATVAALVRNFGPVSYAVENTSEKLNGDSLRVTQAYLLDASTQKAGDTSEIDFVCPLAGTTSETDFSITGLTAGKYAFVMVEASGQESWLLSFLLEQEGTAWQMAGFYPHSRAAGGKDGLWFWNDARQKVAANEPFLAWLEYATANTLLEPAEFVSSTNLDKLRAEQRQNAPAGLADGISVQDPLAVKAADGKEVRITSLATDINEPGTGLRLILHYAATAAATPEASRMNDLAAAQALLAAHPEVRQAFASVLVFGHLPNENPSANTFQMTQIP